MQLANVQVALSGHKGNTVRKYDVTPAEVVTLQRLHGVDAVFDIEPLKKEVERTKREERNRLAQTYGWQEGDRFVSPVVTELYPGNANNIEENFDELDIVAEAFRATGRMTTIRPIEERNALQRAGKHKTSQKAANSKLKPEIAEYDEDELDRRLDQEDSKMGSMPDTGNAGIFA